MLIKIQGCPEKKGLLNKMQMVAVLKVIFPAHDFFYRNGADHIGEILPVTTLQNFYYPLDRFFVDIYIRKNILLQIKF